MTSSLWRSLYSRNLSGGLVDRWRTTPKVDRGDNLSGILDILGTIDAGSRASIAGIDAFARRSRMCGVVHHILAAIFRHDWRWVNKVLRLVLLRDASLFQRGRFRRALLPFSRVQMFC